MGQEHSHHHHQSKRGNRLGTAEEHEIYTVEKQTMSSAQRQSEHCAPSEEKNNEKRNKMIEAAEKRRMAHENRGAKTTQNLSSKLIEIQKNPTPKTSQNSLQKNVLTYKM